MSVGSQWGGMLDSNPHGKVTETQPGGSLPSRGMGPGEYTTRQGILVSHVSICGEEFDPGWHSDTKRPIS